MLRRVEFIAEVAFERGNALTNETVLVRTNKGVSFRLMIAVHEHSSLGTDRANLIAQRRFFEAQHAHVLERKQRKEHVLIEVRDDSFPRHRGIMSEIF